MTFFQILFDNTYFTMDQVRNFEVFCIKRLNYNLNLTIPWNFLNFFVLGGIIFTSDLTYYMKNINKSTAEIAQFSRAYAFVNEILEFTMESK
jgi:hypothetical protein